MNTETIEINGNEYPLALCKRLVNGKECGTSMNPSRKFCTGCEQVMKKTLQDSLIMK